MPSSQNERLVQQAIRDRQLIAFSLHGLDRIAEPHDLGERAGTLKLLIYQLRGASRSGRLPDWRLVNVDQIVDLRILPENFAGGRGDETSQRHPWDRLIARVAPARREGQFD